MCFAEFAFLPEEKCTSQKCKFVFRMGSLHFEIVFYHLRGAQKNLSQWAHFRILGLTNVGLTAHLRISGRMFFGRGDELSVSVLLSATVESVLEWQVTC